MLSGPSHSVCRESILDLVSSADFKQIIKPVLKFCHLYEQLNFNADVGIKPALKPFILRDSGDVPSFSDGFWVFLFALEFGYDTLGRYFDFGSIPTLLSCESAFTPYSYDRKRNSGLAQECLEYAAEVLHEPIAAYTQYLNATHCLWCPPSSIDVFENSICRIPEFYDQTKLLSLADLYRVGFIRSFLSMSALKPVDEDEEYYYVQSYTSDDVLSFMCRYLQSLRAHGYKIVHRYRESVKALPIVRTCLSKRMKSHSRYCALAMCLIGDELSGRTVGIEKEPLCRKEFLPKLHFPNGGLDAVKWYVRALQTDFEFVKDLVPPEIPNNLPQLKRHRCSSRI